MRRLTDDRGAVTLTFAFVLLGLFLPLMLVVGDYGRIVVERRQLQNSADAAAIAVAFDCARNVTNPLHLGCSASTSANHAEKYANANDSDDALTKVLNPLELDLPGGRVTVTTRSRQSTSDDSISLWALSFFDENNANIQIDAKATARWGGAFQAEGLALIVNRCLYDNFGGAALLTPEIAATLPEATAPLIVINQAYGPCAEFHPSGGQGWVLPATDPCQIQLFVGPNDVTVEVGTSNPCNYPGKTEKDQAAAMRAALYQKIVYLPIASSYSPKGGSNGSYLVDGWAAMYVTGWNFGGHFEHGIGKCVPPSSDGRCIRGYFVNAPPTTGPVGGPSLGVQNVQLIK